MWDRVPKRKRPITISAKVAPRAGFSREFHVPRPTSQIAGIYRYPVKGLTPEQLLVPPERAGRCSPTAATPSKTARAALIRPTQICQSPFPDAAAGRWLAALRTHFDEPANVLTIRHNGASRGARRPRNGQGRAAIEQFFGLPAMQSEIKGPPKILDGRRPQLFGRRQKSRLDHQSRKRSRHRKHRRASPSTRCASAAISMSRAGRPGMSSTWSAERIAIGDARPTC